jgi:hypothetical protein
MKTLKLLLLLMMFFVISGAFAQGKKDLSNNSSKEMQTLGGVTSEGNLQILIYDNANMQVFRYISGQWVNQWYGSSSKSIWFYADGSTYSGNGCYFNGANNIMTTVSNTNIDANTNELVMESNGTLRIKQITYYPPGSAVIYYTWEVTNISVSTISDLRLFSGGDTYLQGGDNGAGFWLGMDNTVGVKKTIGTNLQKLNMQGITIPYAYESRGYWDVYQSVVNNALTNVLDENEWTDNGMALEYRKASLIAGTTWTIEAIEKFSASPITNVIVTAPLSGQVAPGSSTDLNFTMRNRTATATTVTIVPTVDLAGWTVELISPESPFILAGNAIQDVLIRINCPAGTPLGTTAKLTLSVTDLSGTASDFCNVTVAQVPTITEQPENQSVCDGQPAIFNITATNAETYQWQEYNNGWSNIIDGGIYSGANTSELNLSAVSISMNNFLYRCVVSNAYGNATSNNATLLVYESTVITNQPVTSTICEGSNTDYAVVVSGASLTYQWQVNAKAGYYNIIDGGVYSGATTNNLVITGAGYEMNEYLYRCVISSACSSSMTSNEAELVVDRAPYISSQPVSSTICETENTSFLIAALGAGLTYQWQVNEGSGFSDISDGGVYNGATTTLLVITGATIAMNGFEYQCIVNGSCNPQATSTSAVLTVNSQLLISSQPQTSTICEGENTTYSVVVSGTNPVYQWQFEDGSGYTNIIDGGVYSGATTSDLQITGATFEMNGYLYRCTLNGACTPSLLSSEAILNVNELPAIVNQPVNSEICEGNNTLFEITASGSGLNYQWQVNESSGFINIVNGGVYSGANTQKLDLTGVTSDMNGYAYQCLVSGSCNPQATSTSVVLTVNSQLLISAQPLTSTICEGENTSYSVVVSGTNPVYQWQVEDGTGFTNIIDGGVYSGANTSNLQITGVTTGMNGYLYRCTLSGTCTTSLLSSEAALNVNELPEIVNQPVSSEICAGENTGFEVTASGTALSYQWQVNEGSGFANITDGGVYSGATTNSLLITGATLNMDGFEYHCNVTGICNPGVVSENVNISILSSPAILNHPVSSEICEKNNTLYLVEAAGPGLTYQWQVNEGSGFFDIIDDEVYSGAITNTLSVSNVPLNMNGFEYNCIVSGLCNPSTTSNTALLTVMESPQVYLGADTTLNQYETITLDAGPGETYVWSLPGFDGRYVTIDFSMLGEGTTNVFVDVTNASNCVGSDTIAITYYIGVGINNLTSDNLVSISPNPTTDIANIHFRNKVKDAEIEVYDLEGRIIIKSKVVDDDKIQINMSNKAKGVYTVKIKFNNMVVN